MHSTSKATVDKLKNLAEISSCYGFESCRKLLVKIADGLEEKLHLTNYNYDNLVNNYFLLNTYIEIVNKEIEVGIIEELLRNF